MSYYVQNYALIVPKNWPFNVHYVDFSFKRLRTKKGPHLYTFHVLTDFCTHNTQSETL